MASPLNIRSVRDQVYDQMHALILDGAWSPGMRIDPSGIAAEFGVSKTPVQAAIQKLTQDGLLSVKPRSGTFVTDLDMAAVTELFQFRLALETGAAEAILAGMTPGQIANLSDIDDKMRTAVAQGLRSDFLRLDAAFHDRIVAASGNAVIRSHYGQVNTLAASSRARSRFEIADFEAALLDHKHILEALRNKDVTAFRAASAQHIENAIAKLRRVSGDGGAV